MMPFGKQLLKRVGESRAVKSGVNLGRRVGSSNVRFKFGEKVTQGKYGRRVGALADGKVRQKIWGKPFTKTSKKNRDIAMSASADKAARVAQRTASRNVPKPDFFPRISAMSPGSKRAIGTGALLGISAAGFVNGIDDKNQVSNAVYDLAFNDPDYDKRVLGKKMGVRSLLAPVPGEMRLRSDFAGLGAIVGQPAGSILTRQTYTDAWRASKKNTPRVDGSVAFGMYNARLG